MTDYQIMDKSQTLDDYFFVVTYIQKKEIYFLISLSNYPFSINETLDQIAEKELTLKKKLK